MSRGRPPRQPRWQPTGDTLTLARHFAAKPARQDMDAVVNVLQAAFNALRKGTVTEMQFGVLNGCIDVARFVERQGVVTGLSPTIELADTVVKAIHARICKHGTWGSTALYAHEIKAMSEFVTQHTFQLRQLGRAEFLRAVAAAKGFIGASAVIVNADQMQALS